MRTHGSSAAGLLLVLVCLGSRTPILNAEITRTRRSTTSSQRQSMTQEIVPIKNNISAQIYALLNNHDPSKINNDMLALVEDQNIISKMSHHDESTLDQQVDQSEVVTVNNEDIGDLDNIEHASSNIEYEPQRINRKGKRRVVNTFNSNPDSVVSSSDNPHLASPDVAPVFYEVPRTIQPKKIQGTTQYYQRPTPAVPRPPEIEPRTRSRDTDYTHPISTVKPQRSRFSRTRSPLNSQTTPPSESTSYENSLPYRSHSIDHAQRKQKYYTDTIITTTPLPDISHTTKPTRRRKNRKRIVNKPLTRQESIEIHENNNNNNNNDNNNYPTEFIKPRNSINSETRNKSRRLGLLAKYDVAPRVFSTVSTVPSKGSQESNFETSIEEGVNDGVTRGSNNRNAYPNAAKNSEGPSNNYPSVVNPVRGSLPGLNRKLYERKDNRESSTVHAKVNSDEIPLDTDDQEESSKSDEDQSNTPHRNSYVSEENNYPQEKNLGDRLIPNRVTSVTPSSLDGYQNSQGPEHTVYSINPVISTAVPHAVSNSYPNNYVYYPPLLTTLAPEEKFDTNNANNLWRPELKSAQPKRKRDEEVGATGRKIYRKVSHGVAEKENADDADELKENGEHESRETPNEEYKEEYNEQQDQQYIHADQSVPKNSRDDSDGYNEEEDKGYRRYPQKYEDGKEEDAQSDGSHDNESHQSLTKGAGDDGGTKKDHGGGEKKFEKGEDEEKEEEHHNADGKKEDEGYKSWHEDEKANKGHHDKERHNNYYDEKDGKEKKHKDESGYQEEHLEGEKGEKQTEFAEKGEHQKGYSTKGEHSVHKKDEFEKRTEFFDEFHDEGDTEKDGEHYTEHEMSKGDSYKVGHRDEEDHVDKYGKETKHEKGGEYNEHMGHKINEGEDSNYEHENMHGKKEDHHDGKKWSFKKGDDGDGGGKKE